jgi:dihydroxyacetone kinase
MRLANIGISSSILTQGGGGHRMGYSGYVGSKLIPNSLGLLREAGLQE